MNWMMIVGILALLIWFVREYMAVFVNANTALVLINWDGKIRVIGPGLGFKIPWLLEKPVDNPKGGVVPLRAIPETFDGVYETKDKTPIKITAAFIRTPVVDYLEQYIKIDDSKRLKGITERVRAILSILIHEYEDRSAVMKNLDNIAKEMEDRFEKAKSEVTPTDASLNLEKYFGENVQQFAISDTELSPELAAATARKEAQAKENETQKLVVDNIRKMTQEIVNDSNGAISHKEAMDSILVIQEKATRETKVFDLGPGAQKVAEGMAGGMAAFGKSALGLAEKFAEKEGDEDGKKE